jgi:5-methyltetrahydrofolate--homocysteine methyltransferase
LHKSRREKTVSKSIPLVSGKENSYSHSNIEREDRMSVLGQITENLIKGKANEVKTLVQQALDEGMGPDEILNGGLISGMSVVGARFKKNEIYVPEVLIAARAMKAGTELLKPLLAESGVEPVGTVVLGTVKGDLHDIGKNLVGMMLEGMGFEVVDLGTDVDTPKFVESARDRKAQIIATSALLTTTMTEMKAVAESVNSSDISVKLMIGGAPVTQSYCDEIGADGYAPDAASAADLAKSYL